MNKTIDFKTAKTIDTMRKKIDHIDDAVTGFFSFMHIQKLRKAHGLTQEEAAIKLNISDRHMRSLEKGTYAPLDLFVEIAVHFDVTLDYLILGQVETKTELALSKKINDQKQAMKSLREHLLAFAMEIEVE